MRWTHSQSLKPTAKLSVAAYYMSQSPVSTAEAEQSRPDREPQAGEEVADVDDSQCHKEERDWDLTTGGHHDDNYSED